MTVLRMRFVAVATSLAIGAACTPADPELDGRKPTHQRSSRPAGWAVIRDPQWLYEIAHPGSWEAGPLLVSHSDTRQWEMLSLATYPLRRGGDRCEHIPVNALNDLGPADAFLSIQEPEYVEALAPRPGAFAVEFATRADYLGEVSIFGCLRDGHDFHYAFVPFEQEGRSFFAHLALGLRAQSGVRRDLIDILSSLRILNAEDFRSRSGDRRKGRSLR
jgi:hypothetical protein